MKRHLISISIAAACLSLLQAPAQPGGHPGGGPAHGPSFGGAMEKLFGKNTSFSASMEMKAESGPHQQAVTGKIAVDQGKSRFEMNMPGNDPHMKSMGLDKVISVVLPDTNTILMIIPSMQGYVESQMPNRGPRKPASAFKVETTELGKETVDGHPCVKNKAVVTDDEGHQTESTLWNATDLNNFPVKIETTQSGAKTVMLFRDVQLSKPDASLFEPPAGYKKYDNMMSLMMEHMGGAGGMPPHGQ